ncbi:MAG TPA: hypothetical protein PLY91_05475 [Methanoregulaceae archaeon]|nr:hypothetical protein [Methanoregulaceae archaeon]
MTGGKPSHTDPNPFKKLNLKANPFEPQGEYLDSVSSIDSGLRVNELKQCNEIIRMARTGGKLIAAVVRGEPGSGKTALANKLMKSARTHPQTKHIYVKMESGSYDDPFFILSLIVDQLDIATSKLNQTKVDRCLAEAADFAFNGLEIQNSEAGDLRKARHLMSKWYGYINALTSVGEHDCVVIHMDEVEDRWAALSMTTPELEKDLKYLRDLLGFVQEGTVGQTFPVALFLYMTEASYQHIGGVNNALKTRLERTIYLAPFTEKDALEFARTRLEQNRIHTTNVGTYDPFTEDGILRLIKNSNDEDGRFSWRKFIINSHDILYANTLSGGNIDQHKVNEWISTRTIEPPKPKRRGTEPTKDRLQDIDFTKQGRVRADKLIADGFFENPDFQLELAIDNIPRILQASFGYFTTEKNAKLAFSITGEDARILISLKKPTEPRSKSDIFCLIVSNTAKGSPASNESEFVLTLPNSPEMMMRYALFDSTWISRGDIDKAKGEISKPVEELIEKLTRFFENHRNTHYIPQLFGKKYKTDEDFEKLIETLYNLTKYDTRNSETGLMGDWGFFDGAGFRIPEWYYQILNEATFDPKKLWEEQFYFNNSQKPVEVAIELLKRLDITDGLKLRQFEERKIKLIRDIEDECNTILTINKTLTEEIGAEHAQDAINKNTMFYGQLSNIKNTAVTLEPVDNVFTNFLNLYQSRKDFRNVQETAGRFNSTIREVSSQYEIRKRSIETAKSKLSKLKFKNPKLANRLEDELRDIKKVFQRPDKLEYLGSSKWQFEQLMTTVSQFAFSATQKADDISKFRIGQLEEAIGRGILDYDGEKLRKFWRFVNESDDLEKIEPKFLELRNQYAALGELAVQHKDKLYIKYSDGKKLLQTCEKYLSEKHLKKISSVIRSMEEKINQAKQLITEGELIKVFDISVDSAFESLAPTLKTLFKQDKVYSLDSLTAEFGLDTRKAREFANFLEENGVLVASFRLVP